MRRHSALVPKPACNHDQNGLCTTSISRSSHLTSRVSLEVSGILERIFATNCVNIENFTWQVKLL